MKLPDAIATFQKYYSDQEALPKYVNEFNTLLKKLPTEAREAVRVLQREAFSNYRALRGQLRTTGASQKVPTAAAAQRTTQFNGAAVSPGATTARHPTAFEAGNDRKELAEIDAGWDKIDQQHELKKIDNAWDGIAEQHELKKIDNAWDGIAEQHELKKIDNAWDGIAEQHDLAKIDAEFNRLASIPRPRSAAAFAADFKAQGLAAQTAAAVIYPQLPNERWIDTEVTAMRRAQGEVNDALSTVNAVLAAGRKPTLRELLPLLGALAELRGKAQGPNILERMQSQPVSGAARQAIATWSTEIQKLNQMMKKLVIDAQ